MLCIKRVQYSSWKTVQDTFQNIVQETDHVHAAVSTFGRDTLMFSHLHVCSRWRALTSSCVLSHLLVCSRWCALTSSRVLSLVCSCWCALAGVRKGSAKTAAIFSFVFAVIYRQHIVGAKPALLQYRCKTCGATLQHVQVQDPITL